MKLSTYIAGLQKILDDNGDLDCYYAVDDEGNGYQQVNYAGSVFFMPEREVGAYYPELSSGREHNSIKVVVVN